MPSKSGIWIDHKQAVVVLLTDAGQEIKKIAFDVGQPSGSKARARPNQKYKPNDYVAENTLERKVESSRKDYYADVIAAIEGASALLLFGPGEAKGEFHKQLKLKKIRGLSVELETADKMTDRQVAAKVQQHYTTTAGKKSISAKVVVKKSAMEKSSKK